MRENCLHDKFGSLVPDHELHFDMTLACFVSTHFAGNSVVWIWFVNWCLMKWSVDEEFFPGNTNKNICVIIFVLSYEICSTVAIKQYVSKDCFSEYLRVQRSSVTVSHLVIPKKYRIRWLENKHDDVKEYVKTYIEILWILTVLIRVFRHQYKQSVNEEVQFKYFLTCLHLYQN